VWPLATHSGLEKLNREINMALLGGAAAAWPMAARAQQRERMRRVEVLLPATADDAQYQAWAGAFVQALAESGWSVDRNVSIATRWATANADAIRRHAAELVALAPDVILAPGASTVGPLLQVTRTVPIVFAIVGDPVGAGFVDSLARPGGNVTGFMAFEYGLGGKWLELLKEIKPGVTRVAVLRDPTTTSGTALFAVIQAMASSLRVEVNNVNGRDAADVQRGITAFAQSSNGGLIVTGSPPTVIHRDLIIKLAAEHGLPTVYIERAFVTAGVLISGRLPATSIAPSRGRSQPICPYKHRSSMSYGLTSGLRRRSVSKCRRRCSRSPTR
jgi:putative tryptophan/tyrosine transport system substrate-binding protein